MTEEIDKLLRKAKRSLEAAKRLFDDGDYDFSVSRAYYSMFYCAEALLLTEKLSFSKHSAVIAAFGKEFIKTGLLRPALHSYLSDAFKDRQTGDYEVIKEITKEQAENHIRNTKEFLRQTINYLEGNR
jgi:uncharacterized protein (UPF0332 family)